MEDDDNQVVIFQDHGDYHYERQKKKEGKKKIEIKPITNKQSRQVTFSKRRKGLFNKASELCSLCGSEVALITFSEAGKPFSFGHPTADVIVHRYINNFTNSGNSYNGDNENKFISHENDDYEKIFEQFNEVVGNVEIEKRRGNDGGFGFWWDKPIDNLGLVELEQLKVSLKGLRDEIYSRLDSINNRCSMSNDFCLSNEEGGVQGCEDYGWLDI